MVRRITMVALVALLCSSTLLAGAHPGGIARQLAMGGSTLGPNGAGPNLVLNPFIVSDPSVMLLNPAYQNMYKDYAWFNLAGGRETGFNPGDNTYGSQFGGVNFAFGKELTIGANLSFDPSYTNILVGDLAGFINGLPAADRGGRAAQTGLAPVEVFEAVAGLDLGSFDVGFAVLYGWATNTSKSSGSPSPAMTDNKLGSSVLGFRAGIAMDLGGGTGFDADAGLRLDNVTEYMKAKNAAGTATDMGEFSASMTEIQVDGRFHMKMSNRVNFVPYANFVSMSGSPKRDAKPLNTTPNASLNDYKMTRMLLAVGAGIEYKISNFYLAGGVSFKTASQKLEASTPAPTVTATSTTTSTSFPQFNLGMEFVFTEWLTGRMGYYRAFHSDDVKNELSATGTSSTNETSISASNSSVFFGSLTGADNSLVTLGLGFKFGNFALDATVSENALRRGFGLVGSQDNINSFGYMTASYCFD
jgi:hypothetical protein